MNVLDVIIIIVLLWAAYRGYSKGIFAQLGVIVGLVAGIAVVYLCGEMIIAWFGVTGGGARVAAYVVLVIVSLMVVVLVARLLSGVFRSVGIGVLDSVGGALLSLVKTALIMSVVLCGLEWVNNRKEVISAHTRSGSLLYYPVISLTSYAFPYLETAYDKIVNPTHDDR